MTVLELIHSSLVLLDGGMGTLLQAAGLLPGERPERWNLTHPEKIREIHRAYFDAGSNIVCANTFGANGLHYRPDELKNIIYTGIRLAKQAAEGSNGPQPKFVAMDLGPSGRMLKPYGDLDFEDAVRLFSEVARLGEAAGADLIFIETMNDSYETKAALLAAKEATGLPVFVSNAYGKDGKLMTGASPEAMTAMLEGLGADAIGLNCSLGPAALAQVARRYLAAASVPVLFKPNAGLPRVENGRTVYDVPADIFAEDTASLVREGVRLAGGCCGTTPEYIRALAGKISGLAPRPIEPKRETVVASFTHSVTIGQPPVLIGERLNPTGKKAFRQALLDRDMGYILREALRQQENGADLLDVNVGIPEADEPELLKRTVEEVQSVTDLPLSIDTSDPAAMEAALRIVNGKPLVNSVNGSRTSLDTVLPLVKRYGAAVIALTLDEQGIPPTAEERIRIAERILQAADSYGIARRNILFDALTMTVSASDSAAAVTLETLRLIRDRLHCGTVLGVSNVSFGLPRRQTMNAVFLTSAIADGLSAAIMNPLSDEMMGAYHACLALHGWDPHCQRYIRYAQEHPETSNAPAAAASPAMDSHASLTALQAAVRKGLREDAARLARAALDAGCTPLSVISEDLIPALDAVGAAFEAKTLYLPQLMMSAEAAEAAFAELKSAFRKGDVPARCPVVLATVRGDVHDIGKNIVRLLLESYGFRVSDLGKDVPPQRILEEVNRLGAPFCGLSALMTTTVPAMEETIRLIHAEAPFCRVIVGGAVLTAAYAKEIGADFYAADAMETVRICGANSE